MSDCPSRTLLEAYENGELSDPRALPLENHLQACPRCRDELSRLRHANPETGVLREVFLDSLPESTQESWFSAADAAGVATMDQPAATPAVDSEARRREGAGPAERGKRSAAELIAADDEWSVPDYERVQLCGEGAYGAVWAVRDRVGVYRALKIIDIARMRKAQVVCRESTALETYCRNVGRHPYLIGVHHVGMVGDRLYYTMELADNAATKAPVTGREFPATYRPLTLHHVIGRRRVQPEAAIEIIRRLLRGLARLHGLDLVHRDIKPANIVFVQRRPKLADIGMVAPGSAENVVIGTPRFMPPDRIMDKTADTFAMGKVLHNMIAGDHPATFPALPRSFREGSHKWDMNKINDVIVRACNPNAAERYQSAHDMLDDLEACADFPFKSLFDDLDSAAAGGAGAPGGGGVGGAANHSRLGAQIVLAALRALPWVLGFAALLIVLNRLR